MVAVVLEVLLLPFQVSCITATPLTLNNGTNVSVTIGDGGLVVVQDNQIVPHIQVEGKVETEKIHFLRARRKQH